jgi:D-alanine-D-alanine ligase
MNKLKVAVLMGGNSTEREVSLMSGREVINNLNKEKYEVIEVVVPEELEKVKKVDVAFLALHGKGGEDGIIQGYLESLGIKYTGCGVLASALGMDKRIFRMVAERENFLMAKETNKVPCVVKPVNGGSSVGVAIAKSEDELRKAIEEAKKYDNEVIVEEYIEGTEVSCGILGDEVLPVIEIVPKKDFFDYEAKYTDGMSEEICPARLPSEITNKIQEETRRIFKIIGGKGYSRVDFIIKNERPYLLEINTLPGMTPNSLLPKEAKEAGYSYSQLLDKIIELSLK